MHEFDEAPQPEDDEERRELALAAAQRDLEHERREHDERVEEVQRRVRRRARAQRVVVRAAERPQRERHLSDERGRDRERDVREHGEPRGRVRALGRRAVLGEEGVAEVREHAGRVDEHLGGCGRGREKLEDLRAFRRKF